MASEIPQSPERQSNLDPAGAPHASARLPVAPEELAVLVTGACNLKCSYCHRSPSRVSSIGQRDVDRTVDALLARGPKRLSVVFTGGEPLLEFRRVKAAINYARRGRSSEQEFSFRLSTNGTRLSAPVITWLETHDVSLQLSCDGDAVAQRHRSPSDGTSTLRALTVLATTSRSYFRRRVSTSATVTPKMAHRISKSVEYLIRKGCSTIELAPAMGIAGWNADDEAGIDREFGIVYRLSLRETMKTGNVPLSAFRRSMRREDPPGHSEWICGGALGRSVTLDIDGTLAGCVLAAATTIGQPSPVMRPAVEALRMGTLDEPLDEQVERMKRRAEAVGVFTDKARRYSSYGRCVDCQYYDRCHICPLAPAFERDWDDPFRVPDFLCAFNRVMLKYRDRFPPQAPREWIEKAGLKPRPPYAKGEDPARRG